MNKLWPCAPFHTYFRAPLLYGMLRAVFLALLLMAMVAVLNEWLR